MKKTNVFFALMLILFATAALDAQASLYPQIARAMARDGYAGRRSAAVARIKKESMDLNRRGFALYEKKDFAGAAELFKQALAADEGNVFARFNLACVLSLAWGGRNPAETPYKSKAALARAVARLLAEAAGADIRWLYKIFVDPDLNPVRGELFSYEDFKPCPGDTCPDQWYSYLSDGTVGYGAGSTELSGLPGAHSSPTATADGFYTVIGDYVFVHIPEKNEILKAQWPGSYMGSDEDGAPNGSLDLFQVKRTAGKKMELAFQPDLWDPEQAQ